MNLIKAIKFQIQLKRIERLSRVLITLSDSKTAGSAFNSVNHLASILEIQTSNMKMLAEAPKRESQIPKMRNPPAPPLLPCKNCLATQIKQLKDIAFKDPK